MTGRVQKKKGKGGGEKVHRYGRYMMINIIRVFLSPALFVRMERRALADRAQRRFARNNAERTEYG